LLDQGHQVVGVEGGAEGLAEARSGGIDLVLLAAFIDGDLGGDEVCARLRAIPELHHIPIVVYTDKVVNTEVADRMYEAGCEVFVGKTQMPNLCRIVDVQLRAKTKGDELCEQNRVLELENRRLEEERQRAVDLGATAETAGAQELLLRELAAGSPDGVLVVDVNGTVRHADRGACELLGSRLVGSTLGKIAPGCGLEAFVRDARAVPREGFRFDVSGRRDRAQRSLMASVLPVTASVEGGRDQLVVLLLDMGRRRVAEEILRSREPGIPRQQLGFLLEAARATYTLDAIVGRSPVASDLRRRISNASTSSEPVLVVGETGAGKTFAARVLHYSGPRTGCLFELQCSSISAESVEGELVGCASEASPGAAGEQPGLLLLASDGTLFLDEVAELPLETQGVLLKALEEGEIQRSGGRRPEPVRCRIVASTSRDLAELAAAGHFLPALAARLSTVTISVPPLSERKADLGLLCDRFLERHGAGRGVEAISPATRYVLTQYDWPGNVAELETTIEEACARAQGVVEVLDLPELLQRHAPAASPEVIPARPPAGPAGSGATPIPGTHVAGADYGRELPRWAISDEDPISLEHYEKKALLRALDHARGDKLAAARLLSVGKSTLYRKLKKHGIS